MDDSGRKQPSEEKKIKFKPNVLSKNESKSWILIITIISFFLSAALLFASSKILGSVNIPVILFSVVLIIILVGIVLDTVGIAVTAADETPFHAMASRKLYGAKQAIKLIRNANKVSSFCNDVVGDICSVISGTASAIIIYKIVGADAETSLAGLAISGMVASLTVGGKAMGKTIAIQNSNYIVYKVSVVVSFILRRFTIFKTKKRQNRSK